MLKLGKAHHNWLGEFLGKGAHEIEAAFKGAGHEIASHAKSVGIGVGEKAAQVVGTVAGSQGLQKTVLKVGEEAAELGKNGKFLEELKAGSKAGTIAAGVIDSGIDIYKVARGEMKASDAVTDVGEKTGMTAVSNELGRIVQGKLPQEKLRETKLNQALEKTLEKVKGVGDKAKSAAEKLAGDLKHSAEKQVEKVADKFKTSEEVELPKIESGFEEAGESVAKAFSRGGMESMLDSVEGALPEIGLDGAEIAVTEEIAVDGAVAGSVEPGGGTVLGALIGVGVGIAAGVVMNEVLKTKVGKEVTKKVSEGVGIAIKETAKEGKKAVHAIEEGGKKAVHEIENEAKNIAAGAKKAEKKVENAFKSLGDELKHIF